MFGSNVGKRRFFSIPAFEFFVYNCWNSYGSDQSQYNFIEVSDQSESVLSAFGIANNP